MSNGPIDTNMHTTNIHAALDLHFDWLEGQQILNELRVGSCSESGFSDFGWKIAKPILRSMARVLACDLRAQGVDVRSPLFFPAEVDQRLYDEYMARLKSQGFAPAGFVVMDGYILYRVTQDQFWLGGMVMNAQTAATAMAAIDHGADDYELGDAQGFFHSGDYEGQLPCSLYDRPRPDDPVFVDKSADEAKNVPAS